MIDIEEILIENPIVAAIRNDGDLQKALDSNVKIVFVLYGSLLNILNICRALRERHKIVFIHVDMIEGLKPDQKGIEYLRDFANPYGIITSKQGNVKYAKNLGLCTIQRVFIIDSISLETAIKSVQASLPTAVEVMPGVASKIIKSMEKEIRLPIIAGGLIKTKKDVMESLSSGAMAISTTEQDLWE